jgi:hypothetical protein
MENIGNLSNLQIELIKMFNYNLDDSQLNDIRDLLTDYFSKKATQEFDNFMSENKFDESTLEAWSKQKNL